MRSNRKQRADSGEPSAVHHDPDRGRFYMDLQAGHAYLQYRPRGERTLDYVSTFVPPEHRQQGIGQAMVKHALDYARERDFRIIPTCPFVGRVIEANREYEDLVAE